MPKGIKKKGCRKEENDGLGHGFNSTKSIIIYDMNECYVTTESRSNLFKF